MGVGCIVDCCMECGGCDGREEHLCAGGGCDVVGGNIMIQCIRYDHHIQYKHGHLATDSGLDLWWILWLLHSPSEVTQHIITSHSVRSLVKIPAGLPLDAADPVLCAGITMYSHWCIGVW